MKKTFMAMLLVGGSMSLFAQNTQTGTTTTQGNTTTNQQTTTGTTQQSTGTTGDPSTQTGSNVSNMSNTGTTGTTGTMNNNTTGTWNGVSANPSTSWAPEKDPSWNWNSNGIWSGSANWNSNPNAPANGSGQMNNTTGTTNADGSMNSSGSYNAYAGSPVSGLPMNVQMRFNQDFPTGVNNQYAWNQYGDWFHTHQLNNGRLMQYFYNTRGDGYALALPVTQSYVPENIINSAIQKYGTNLYSISMVKPADTAATGAYQIGLIQGGQLSMHYLDENGATVSNVWRVDSVDNSGAMTSAQANAAMGTNSTMGQDMNSNSQSSGMTNSQSSGVKESKIKIEHADGTETKIKTKNGKTKIKQDD